LVGVGEGVLAGVEVLVGVILGVTLGVFVLVGVIVGVIDGEQTAENINGPQQVCGFSVLIQMHSPNTK